MKKRMLRTVAEIWIYFMMYSILGWIYEVFLEVVIYRWGFSNRGVFLGPYCIIYGVGALLLLLTLGGLKRKRIFLGRICITPILVFFGIIAVTTITELIGSYIMETMTGGWMWNYERFAFNFQGRIALNSSIRFGIGGMIFLYQLQPLFEKGVRRWRERTVFIIGAGLGIIFLADILWTFEVFR